MKITQYFHLGSIAGKMGQKTGSIYEHIVLYE